MKKKPDSEPYVSPWNRMSEEQMKGLKAGEGNAVLEMDEERIMPLYMFISDINLAFPPLPSADMNYMVVISHIKKNDRLEGRGRMRFEESGRKMMFELKSDFALTELEKAKQEVKDMYQEMKEKMRPVLTEKHDPFELGFEIGETLESIMAKMDASNYFNIGTMPMEKKK